MLLASKKQIVLFIGRNRLKIAHFTSSEKYVTFNNYNITVIRACKLISQEPEKGAQVSNFLISSKQLKKELSLKVVMIPSACSTLIGKGGETI